MVRNTLVVMGSLLAFSACGANPGPSTPGGTRGTVITRQQIEDTGAASMWDALIMTVRFAHFQESWLGDPERIVRRGNGSMVVTEAMPVYIDRVKVIDMQVLASYSARDIVEIQVLSGLDGSTFFGTNAGDGVILINTIDSGG